MKYRLITNNETIECDNKQQAFSYFKEKYTEINAFHIKEVVVVENIDIEAISTEIKTDKTKKTK